MHKHLFKGSFFSGRVIVVILLLASALNTTQAHNNVETRFKPNQSTQIATTNFVPGELLVKFKPSYDQTSRSVWRSRSGSLLKKHFKNNSNLEHWRLPNDASITDTIEILKASGTVEYAVPNYIRQRYAIPDDALFNRSWALQNIGQTVPTSEGQVTGIAGEDMQLEQAWDITTGSKDVVIAIHDDGVDIDHPDLQANIWVNPGEIAGDSLDNDNNGYIDDVNGWDAADNDNNPNPELATDSHGTVVAGAAGTVGNNNEGVSGSAWNVSLMPIRHAYDDASIIDGLDYAIAAKADILVASWGSTNISPALEEAVTRLEQAGILMVVAAGNNSVNNDHIKDFPSGYPNSNIIAVTGSTARGEPIIWAHTGQTTVDLAAPGEGVYLPISPDVEAASTDINGNPLPVGSFYGYTSGTSFSAPYVAGIAALLKSRYPDSDHRDLKARLMSGTRPFRNNNWSHLSASNGQISALKALQADPAPLLVINKVTAHDEDGAIISRFQENQTYTLNIALENLWQTAGNVSAVLESPDEFVNIATNNASYGDIEQYAISSQNTLGFTFSEDPGSRPIRFELSLNTDAGQQEKRRFVLENTETSSQVRLIFDTDGNLLDAVQPDSIRTLDSNTLTLPTGHRFIDGIDMTFTSGISAGSEHVIGWALSYVPEHARIYFCTVNDCTIALPDDFQPALQNSSALIYTATDGTFSDSDGANNSQIQARLVLLEACATGVEECSLNANDSGGGGGSFDLDMLLLLLILAGFLRLGCIQKIPSEN